MDLEGYLLLPGLINAHDHLEFNLYPRLGTRTYANVREWAADIHKLDDSPVREHLRVPLSTRLFWGGMKNLVAGVTTVSHHNPYHARIFDSGFPVRVVRRFGWAHSLAFSPDVGARFGARPRNNPSSFTRAKAQMQRPERKSTNSRSMAFWERARFWCTVLDSMPQVSSCFENVAHR